MKFDIVIAGVGGQGVRTTASILRAAAVRSGLLTAQSETHGHPQRGGAVAVHLRLSEAPIESPEIGLGQADLILSLEPLESTRHMELLSAAGTVVTATDPVPNVPNYPRIDDLLLSVLRLPSGFLVDALKLAKQAGGERVANAVLIGAATDFLPMEPSQIREAIAEVFGPDDDRVREVNLAAYDAGRAALHHREMVDEFDTFALAGH